MSEYKTVLLAIDLSEEAVQVANKAHSLVSAGEVTLHVIHVIEPLSFAYGGDIPMDFSGIQDEIQKQAKSQLSTFAAKYDISPEHQHIVIGRPETEIHAVAEELGADLVVVGSHGRHGLALLLGSTANGVLHGAGCDVLAVRVEDE
ncbi:MAG: universal stress protein A [Oceanicoccus sp.]|jgi:universal stress protein A